MARKPKKEAAPAADTDLDDDIQEQTIAVARETLTGDIRDFVLDRLRHEQDKKPWHQRSEADQRDTVHSVESGVREAITKAIEILAAGGRRTIKATLDQVTVKDGVVGKLVLSRHDPLRHALFDSVGSTVLIVVADPDDFTGERAPVEIHPDQGDLERIGEAGVVHSEIGTVEKPFH